MIFFCLFFKKKKKKNVQKWWLALLGILESPKSNQEVLNFHKVPKKRLQNNLDAQKWPYHRRDDNYTTHAPVWWAYVWIKVDATEDGHD